MGSFSKGLCVGLGLSLLFAPMKGDEMRHLVGQRIRYLRGIPPENPELKQSVAQMGARLQEVQTRAEQARQMSATAQSAVLETASSAGEIQRDLNRVAQQAGSTPPSTIQGTTSSTQDVQQDLNRAARQMGSTTPSIVQGTTSSTQDVQQRDLNRAARQMGATPPGPLQDTTSSTEETQQDLNRITRQPGTDNPPPPRRPRG
jgi:cell division septum initiation protein DivIVA